jgi:3-hydroxybutyryl-CoA dehydratase
MSEFALKVGDQFTFTKTVSESDVYLFAGITGDLSPNHVNEEAMKATRYGGRIAHGALLIGYMSTCSTLACEAAGTGELGTPVSLGYDRVRFLAGVLIGDTVTVTYTISAVKITEKRTVSSIEIKNQRGELVAVASHILKWVD